MSGLATPTPSRAQGAAEAERFDQLLRDREARAREQRLARLLLAGDDDRDWRPLDDFGGSSQLQRQLELLREFHSAVLRSRSWRLLQMLRRPFGRAW